MVKEVRSDDVAVVHKCKPMDFFGHVDVHVMDWEGVVEVDTAYHYTSREPKGVRTKRPSG